MEKIIRLKSYAKINLGLSVLAKRDNGYHDVDMIMQSLDLYDLITLKKNGNSEIRVFCNKELNCKEENNAAYKATNKFFEYIGVNNFFIDIGIKKNIPICAGLAGGSSNAAAVLIGLNSMMGTNLDFNQLSHIGKGIGADVPFCVFGGTMRAIGIGTDLKKIKNNLDYFVLLVKPKMSISTKDSYDRVNICNIFHKESKIDNILIGIEKNDAKFMAKNLFNDLESSLLYIQKKEIDYVKEYVISMGAINSCMSGSGPSVYGIFDDETTAIKCFESIKAEYEESFLCRPLGYGVKII